MPYFLILCCIILVIAIYVGIIRWIYRINDQIQLLEEIRDQIHKIAEPAEELDKLREKVRTESRTLGSGQM